MFSLASRQQIASTVTQDFSCLEPDNIFSLDFTHTATSKNLKLKAVISSYQARTCSLSVLAAIDPNDLSISDLSRANVLYSGEVDIGENLSEAIVSLAMNLQPKPKRAVLLHTHTILSCGSESLSSGISSVSIRGDGKNGINQKSWVRRLGRKVRRTA
jgi:hypothetical protein